MKSVTGRVPFSPAVNCHTLLSSTVERGAIQPLGSGIISICHGALGFGRELSSWASWVETGCPAPGVPEATYVGLAVVVPGITGLSVVGLYGISTPQPVMNGVGNRIVEVCVESNVPLI